MGIIKNEHGISVFTTGAFGSPAWIKSKYQHQLKEQIISFLKQMYGGKSNIVIEFHGDLEDKRNFRKAVRFYSEYPRGSLNRIFQIDLEAIKKG